MCGVVIVGHAQLITVITYVLTSAAGGMFTYLLSLDIVSGSPLHICKLLPVAVTQRVSLQKGIERPPGRGHVSLQADSGTIRGHDDFRFQKGDTGQFL